MESGLVFDIKRFAVNDGPGIRVTVFFKGCPLRCAWCHNPESISPKIERLYTKEKCIGCKACIEACPQNALQLSSEGIVCDANLCNLSGECAEVCPTKATEISGKKMLVSEVMETVLKDQLFMDQSGGGVTFSGGEPMLQGDFLLALLKECKAHGIHRVVDTTGFTSEEQLLEVAKYTDLFLYDLKHMDSETHRKWTGIPNERILSNLRLLSEKQAHIQVRLPFVGGVNSDDKNLKAMATFLADLPGASVDVNILPYHDIMTGKYHKLGREYDPQEMQEPKQEEIQRAIEIFSEAGITATEGG